MRRTEDRRSDPARGACHSVGEKKTGGGPRCADGAGTKTRDVATWEAGAVKPPAHVYVVGTLNVDHVWQVPALPRAGQTVLATVTERQFGGKGANQAVAAARQGTRVTLIGAVGDDADGRLYREQLAREGIEVKYVATAAGVATGTAHLYVDPSGENLIVVDRGANAAIDESMLAGGLSEPGADVLLVQLECDLAIAVAALCLAVQQGVRGILNASPTNRAFPWGAHAIDTVIVNEHECAECFGFTPAELSGLPVSVRRALLAERKVRHVVVTQGAEQTLHFAAEGGHVVPAYRVVPRDTVGAGDMFAGALATELAAGREWEPALRYANVAAALSTLAVGAQAAMPRRAEVEAVIARGFPQTAAADNRSSFS
ncbi:MAG: ribokinase [Opitutus sp.]|nr:ribokinase [Opitutus sp.]